MVATDPPSLPASPTKAASSASQLLGTLVVIVIQGRHLTNRVRIGKQNPYCVVSYGLNKKKTQAIERGGQQPFWDTEFRFELLKDEREQLSGEPAKNAVVNVKGGVMPIVGASSELKVQAASATSPSLNGKKLLRLAVYADDAKDPKLVGEATLELDDVIKKGTFDGWVTLERKGKFSGELKLELTWYSQDPPKGRAPQRQEEPAGAYGGPGSRTDDYSDGGSTEEWDGSDVGPSPTGGRLDVAADYPDPDLAPLSQSMSALAVSQGRPLPAPPSSTPYYNQPYQGYAPSPQPPHLYNHEQPSYQQPYQPEPNRRASYAGPPTHEYAGGASEFGGYAGGHQAEADQSTINASTHGRVSGFQQLADQHYAQQSYSSNSYQQQQPYAPPPQTYEPPPSLSYSGAPHAPYSQAPAPPQPPAAPSHWNPQHQSHPLPQPPPRRPHSSAGQYASGGQHQQLHHSTSTSSFNPHPAFVPPPTLQQQPDYAYSQAPTSQFAPPQIFSPPPAPPAFGQYPHQGPPQPPQPPPSRYGTSSNPPPPSAYAPQPPQPPPPRQQQYNSYPSQASTEEWQYSHPPLPPGGPQGDFHPPQPSYSSYDQPPPPQHQQYQQQQYQHQSQQQAPTGSEPYNPYYSQQQQY